jgi:hypothetical protein
MVASGLRTYDQTEIDGLVQYFTERKKRFNQQFSTEAA